MSAIDIVKAFYDADLANDTSVVSEFFHKDCELHWTSSQGFMLLNYNEIEVFFEGTRKSYDSLRFEFTHLIEAGNTVTTRHTLFANTIENPDVEVVLAHFSAIWEVKDGKLYRCFEISNQADENDSASLKSYSERKI
ncbi:nuclear transport factor 2 family protein [Winogradskyella echinorum]|uniref:Nuclear transport factor 2 family protein n=1 Tax=Winogradskyella echinorum TaxID=538189 RepID=A0ABR6Y1W5_9FLAO|nr:nuclear transport factor 2 family protein [Winogradskyella echinorum]MBC3846245.1 nuclear transport factor 2 family protein [Winogradskyella echinorum]MBC5750593.1 nuclear transport factor 2 family protein [Winogradskyella echinorum]